MRRFKEKIPKVAASLCINIGSLSENNHTFMTLLEANPVTYKCSK